MARKGQAKQTIFITDDYTGKETSFEENSMGNGGLLCQSEAYMGGGAQTQSLEWRCGIPKLLCPCVGSLREGEPPHSRVGHGPTPREILTHPPHPTRFPVTRSRKQRPKVVNRPGGPSPEVTGVSKHIRQRTRCKGAHKQLRGCGAPPSKTQQRQCDATISAGLN